MPLRTVTHRPVSVAKSTTPVRPAPVRVSWELNAPWRALGMVESAGRNGAGALKESPIPGWGNNQPGVNVEFRDQVSPNLKNFLKDGKSSLTPYEATQINFGLGGGGQWHVSDREKKSGYMRGDRVELTVTHPDKSKETIKGIVVNDGGVLTVDKTNGYHFVHPEYDNGTQGRDKAVIKRVVAGALNDGTLEAKGG